MTTQSLTAMTKAVDKTRENTSSVQGGYQCLPQHLVHHYDYGEREREREKTIAEEMNLAIYGYLYKTTEKNGTHSE